MRLLVGMLRGARWRPGARRRPQEHSQTLAHHGGRPQ